MFHKFLVTTCSFIMGISRKILMKVMDVMQSCV